MSRFLVLISSLSTVLLVAQPTPCRSQAPIKPDEELVEKVRKSIDLGVKFLINEQHRTTHNWEGVLLKVLAEMEGGQTALVTLALLNSGVKPDDPVLVTPLEYLRSLPPRKTYVVALQNLVFAEARQSKDLPLIRRNADWLIDQAIGYRNGAGQLEGWSYPGNTFGDNSNTQYALLGLYAAKQAGVKIEDKVWKAIQEYYIRTQMSESPTSGKWPYFTQGPVPDQGTFSMTVAGVCGLIIAGMGLDESEQRLDPGTGVAASCGVYGSNTAMAKGMNYIGSNFNFESPKSSFYNIYGLERLGRLSGQRFIDKYDWYREGCEKLIRMQSLVAPTRGAILAEQGRSIDASPILSTSFALLFLSKGRTPVLISKFAWGTYKTQGNGTFAEIPTGQQGQVNWNRKHNDTRHVVEFCSKELFNGVPLSWQVYDVRRRDFGNDGQGGKSTKEKILEEVGSLLQSPVLYLNGHGEITLTPIQEEIIKTYLEEGGFLLAEACCGDRDFAASFRKLMLKLFPDNTLKKMSTEHAILKMFPGITSLDFPDVETLERGCRTICVFSPTPLAGFWEEEKYMPKEGRKPANQGEKAYCLARNVVAYVTGMELPKPKLTTQKVVEKGGPEVGVTRSHFKAAQLKLNGESEPAPDALKNLMSYLRENARLEVSQNTAILPPNDQLIRFKFNYIHGRKPLEFTEYQRESILSNLQTGGLLLADAACGGFEQWKAFDRSFRDECAKMFPDQKLVVIQERTEDGKEEPLFKIAREAGINIKTVRCRREQADGKGPQQEMQDYKLYLEGIKVDGRWVVVYSKYDIGCAIEGHKAADCLGHDKDSAIRIASAVVLYSLKR